MIFEVALSCLLSQDSPAAAQTTLLVLRRNKGEDRQEDKMQIQQCAYEAHSPTSDDLHSAWHCIVTTIPACSICFSELVLLPGW